jgi:hypothetical protein
MKLINIYETKTSIIYNVMLPDNDGAAMIAVPKPTPKLYGTSAMICEKYNHQIDDFLKTIK